VGRSLERLRAKIAAEEAQREQLTDQSQAEHQLIVAETEAAAEVARRAEEAEALELRRIALTGPSNLDSWDSPLGGFYNLYRWGHHIVIHRREL
jgi:hypothetical protein